MTRPKNPTYTSNKLLLFDFRNFHTLRLFSMGKGYEKMFALTLKPLIFHISTKSNNLLLV